MPTKLKKPITVTFCHAENAIIAILRSEIPLCHLTGRGHAIALNAVENEMCSQLESALAAQGIDCLTWTPHQPLKAGKYDAEILPGGAIKVECQMITREQILELKKASDEAVEPAEPGWPKWFGGRGSVWRINSATKGRRYDLDLKAWGCLNWELSEMATDPKSKPITREQAKELIGDKALNESGE